MSKRWPPPTYEDVRIEGKPNNCWFVVSCRLGEFMQKGKNADTFDRLILYHVNRFFSFR